MSWSTSRLTSILFKKSSRTTITPISDTSESASILETRSFNMSITHRTRTPCRGMRPWVLPTVSSGSPQLFRKSEFLRRTKRGSKFLSPTPRRRFCRALGSSAARELLMESSRSIKVVIAAAVTSKKASLTRQPTLCFGRRSVFFSFFHSPGVGIHAQLTLRVPLFRPSSKIRFGFMCRVVFIRICLEKPASASARVCMASESLLACGRNICRRPFAS